jgi:hypothetical protein
MRFRRLTLSLPSSISCRNASSSVSQSVAADPAAVELFGGASFDSCVHGELFG